jgi:hypothetical protein
MSNLAGTLDDPRWFPFEFDASFDNISFIFTTADDLRAAPFLDQRFLSQNMQRRQLSVSEVSTHLEGKKLEKLPMIFHSAFCCSTLMATALDHPDICLSLKEPQILMSLANAKRMMPRQNRAPKDYKERFDIVIKLLSRRFQPEEQILLKPTNSVNNILTDVLSIGFPVVLMYASLEDFLISVLKKGEACKSFIRTQFNIFSLDQGALANIPQRQAMTFTDLQISALVWRHQLELFKKYHTSNSSILTLRDKNFLGDKFDGLSKTSSALQLALANDVLKTISEGEVFRKNAKFGDQEMDGTQRQQDAASIKKRYAEELSFTLKWAQSVRLEGDVLT